MFSSLNLIFGLISKFTKLQGFKEKYYNKCVPSIIYSIKHYTTFINFQITNNISITEQKLKNAKPGIECQFNKNKLDFNDGFDSDDEVIFYIEIYLN